MLGLGFVQLDLGLFSGWLEMSRGEPNGFNELKVGGSGG